VIVNIPLVTIQLSWIMSSLSISQLRDLFVIFVISSVLQEMLWNRILQSNIKCSFFLCLDYDTYIKSKMAKNGVDWQCLECGKLSRVKTNIYEHIESIHTDFPGYICPYCNRTCKSRNALRAHKFREHNYGHPSS